MFKLNLLCVPLAVGPKYSKVFYQRDLTRCRPLASTCPLSHTSQNNDILSSLYVALQQVLERSERSIGPRRLAVLARLCLPVCVSHLMPCVLMPIQGDVAAAKR